MGPPPPPYPLRFPVQTGFWNSDMEESYKTGASVFPTGFTGDGRWVQALRSDALKDPESSSMGG